MAQRIPLISIITPVFNGERYIQGCLDNVIAQNCPDIEHIVMDGASKDRTVAIAREIASDYDHVRVISEPDRGQSHALNKAIRLARAAYVGILNVDDFYERGTLNRVAELIRNTPEPTMFVGNCNLLDDAGNVTRVNRPVLDVDLLLLGAEFPCNPSSYFYPACLHEQIGYYDEGEHFVMDAAFLFAALPHIRTVHFGEVWGNFRMVKGTKTFEDWARGTSRPRMRRVIFKSYLRRPLSSKIKIAVRAVLWPAASWRRRQWAALVMRR